MDIQACGGLKRTFTNRVVRRGKENIDNIMEKRIFVALCCMMMLIFTADTSAAESEKAATGARIYDEYCSSCHGAELNNTARGVTFDLRRLRTDERSRFENSVLNGKNQMPPWRDVLDLAQIDALWAYIRATVITEAVEGFCGQHP